MLNDVVKLISTKSTQDEDGFDVVEEIEFECLANVKSATRSEFYAAASLDIKVNLMVEVNYIDWECAIVDGVKPTLVSVDDIKHRIIRAYRVEKNNTMELTLSEVE